VHRGRKADERFIGQYPGNDLTIGDEVIVDNEQFIRFHHAAVDHIAMIGDEAERVLRKMERAGKIPGPLDDLIKE
jgi:hypothetical protein